MTLNFKVIFSWSYQYPSYQIMKSEIIIFLLRKFFAYLYFLYNICRFSNLYQMLLPYLEVLNQKKIILGSVSKSRNELFTIQKIKYEKIPSTFVQDLDKKSFQSPADYNLETGRGKVNELVSRFKKDNKQWDILVCGDTIVYFKGQIIEKPENQEHCVQMMSKLSQNTHEIYTSNFVLFNSENPIAYQWVSKCQVTFGEIPIQSLRAFARTDEPYIHSGGYQLTAISGSFIKSTSGSHTAIQGLDIYEVCRKIIQGSKKLGWIK